MSIFFAGVSRTDGKLRFRTATSPARFQQLGKLGDTDIEMINVNVETKSQAAKELLGRNFANGRADIEALLIDMAKDDNPFKSKRVAKKITVSKIDTEPKLSIAEANARVALTVKEISPARALQFLVTAMPKQRRSRKAVDTAQQEVYSPYLGA